MFRCSAENEALSLVYILFNYNNATCYDMMVFSASVLAAHTGSLKTLLNSSGSALRNTSCSKPCLALGQSRNLDGALTYAVVVWKAQVELRLQQTHFYKNGCVENSAVSSAAIFRWTVIYTFFEVTKLAFEVEDLGCFRLAWCRKDMRTRLEVVSPML